MLCVLWYLRVLRISQGLFLMDPGWVFPQERYFWGVQLPYSRKVGKFRKPQISTNMKYWNIPIPGEAVIRGMILTEGNTKWEKNQYEPSNKKSAVELSIWSSLDHSLKENILQVNNSWAWLRENTVGHNHLYDISE